MENIYNIPILTNGDMSSSSLTSSVIDLSKTDGYAIYASWTGAPVGSIKLEASLDGLGYVDITESIQPITVAGNFMWNVGPVYYDKVRVVYTRTSGTGTLNVSINGKAEIMGA